jgi:hypothetical protein
MVASCECSRNQYIHLGGVGKKAPQLGEVAVDPLPAAALGLAVATRRRQCLSVRHLPHRHAPQLRLQAPQQTRHHTLAAPLRRELLRLMMPLVLLHRIEAEAEHAKDVAEGPHGRRVGERRGAEPGSEQLMVRSLLAPVLDAPIPHGCLPWALLGTSSRLWRSWLRGWWWSGTRGWVASALSVNARAATALWEVAFYRVLLTPAARLWPRRQARQGLVTSHGIGGRPAAAPDAFLARDFFFIF